MRTVRNVAERAKRLAACGNEAETEPAPCQART